MKRFGCTPVFLPEDTADLYYNGFCNRTLWPLFHSMASLAHFDDGQWRAYCAANELFAKRLHADAGPKDVFWIQDFHLMLVPQMLRQLRPKARIGFFLHVPFPSYNTLRSLPWHAELLQGTAGADLVGFHTYDYAHSFLACLRRLLGWDNSLGEVAAADRSFQVDVFPMGVDFARFSRVALEARVRREVAALRARPAGRRLLLSVSRLDYTKGIPQLLDGLETFLVEYPRWRGRFQQILVVTPSRERVSEYRELKRQVDERVGRLNGRYGTVDWTPVRYISTGVGDAQLAALYLCSDVAVITPTRDGMNLVAKEYLAARADGAGVLVLSDLAGAARELTQAILVNPNSPEEVAAALDAALSMPLEERKRRSEAMRAHLETRDVNAWARRFLERLDVAAASARAQQARRLAAPSRRSIVAAFAQAARRLVVLDYDGTLVPFAQDPHGAQPDPELLSLLRALAGRPGVQLVILSGRDRSTMDGWLGALDAVLVAEHGAWVRWRGRARWVQAMRADSSWKGRLRELMQLFVDRIPGSFIEEKEFSLVWHWRAADPDIGSEAARELVEAITAITANTEVMALAGNRIVEAKTAAASKGPFFVAHLASPSWPFILAVGDDATDESLFRVLPPSSHSVRVGWAPSSARYNVKDHREVRRLLQQLAQIPSPAARARRPSPSIKGRPVALARGPSGAARGPRRRTLRRRG